MVRIVIALTSLVFLGKLDFVDCNRDYWLDLRVRNDLNRLVLLPLWFRLGIDAAAYSKT